MLSLLPLDLCKVQSWCTACISQGRDMVPPVAHNPGWHFINLPGASLQLSHRSVMVQSNASTAACEAIQLYKEARALLLCHILSKNHKTKRKLQSSCKAHKTSRSAPTCHASCPLSLLPSRYASPPPLPPSALFTNERRNLHLPSCFYVFTFFISPLPST